MKKLKGLIIVLVGTLSIFSCKKEGVPTAQELLDKGESMATILSLKPVDSLVGKLYLGGFIFYVDSATATGKIVGGSDVSESASWGCSGQDMTGATDSAFGFGAANTDFLVQNCTSLNSAANFCSGAVENGFTDWYLPTEDELKLVYTVLGANKIGGFADDYYWTSTQTPASTNAAQHVLFVDGTVSFSSKSNGYKVRAVKDF
jgi:hypothetical protein